MSVATVSSFAGQQAHALRHPCPVCQSRQGVELGELRYASFDNSQLPDRLDVVMCRDCGLVTCDTPASQIDYDRFYASYGTSSATVPTPLPEESQYFATVAETLGRYVDRSDAIVDVGCGDGKFLATCQQLGFTSLCGVDPCLAAVEALRAAGLAGELGTAGELPTFAESPKVIVLSHIVEHLASPYECLRHIRDSLGEGGLLYVEVPDTNRFEGYCQGDPLQFFYPQHLLHLDSLHLANLLSASGFRQVAHGERVRAERELSIPSVWGLFTPDGRESDVRAGFELGHKVQSWLAAGNLDPRGELRAVAESGRRTFVWGVGIHVQLMLGMSPLRDCNIACCVDRNTQLHERRIGDLAIESTDRLREATEQDVVVIGSRIHRQAMERILEEEIRFPGQIVTL